MLVYCANCRLTPSGGVEQILDTITEYLSLALERPFETSQMRAAQTSRFRDGVTIDYAEKISGSPRMYAVRHTVPDLSTPGRLWTTEVGIRQTEGNENLSCSVMFQLDDQSTVVSSPVIPTRPEVLDWLIEKCPPCVGTPGLETLALNDDTIEDITHFIRDDARLHPLVLLPKQPKESFIQIERFRNQLIGVADVCVFDPQWAHEHKTDYPHLASLLQAQMATFFYPLRLKPVGAQEPTTSQTNLFIRQDDEVRQRSEDELVTTLLQHANRQCALRHISLDLIKTSLFRQAIAQRLQHMQELEANTQEAEEYASLLEEADRELTTKDAQITKLQQDLENVIDENRQLQSKFDSLRQNVENKSGGPLTNNANEAEFRPAFEALFTEGPTLEQSLILLEQIYPERIVVLDTAKASAKKSQRFKYRSKAFDLLRALVTDYYQILQTKGDAEARKVFGNAYSARESKTVESNPRSRELHTFHYKGAPMVMLKHLKIGIKDSIYETVRIYFEWDQQEGKIIIGHCGPHLEHPC